MKDIKTIARIRQKFARLLGVMDQRMRRQWAAAEAIALGWGGVTMVSRATGLAHKTIMAGTRELENRRAGRSKPTEASSKRARTGRKPASQTDPGLAGALDALIAPCVRHSRWTLLRWTCDSTSKLAEELKRRNHPVSDRTVAALLRSDGYHLQDRRKCNEGSSHARRNAQFDLINDQAAAFQKLGHPVIWLDIRRNESARKFSPNGAEGDVAAQDGWVSAGIDNETIRFAVVSLGHWWQETGRGLFPSASSLLIISDVGGGDSGRSGLWRAALRGLANEVGLPLEICHFPPGTTKWNQIERHLFSFSSRGSHGRPLARHEAIINLIGGPASGNGSNRREGGNSRSRLDGALNSRVELFRRNNPRGKFQDDWNYTIHPVQNQRSTSPTDFPHSLSL